MEQRKVKKKTKTKTLIWGCEEGKIEDTCVINDKGEFRRV